MTFCLTLAYHCFAYQLHRQPTAKTSIRVSFNLVRIAVARRHQQENEMSQSIAVIKGDGIGPEIMEATLRVLDALDCGLDYHFIDAGLSALENHGTLIPKESLDTIERFGIALKGPLTTPIGKGFSSINVQMRRHFDLYANVRPAVSFPGTRSRYDDIDMITVRENTEGAYLSDGQEFIDDGNTGISVIKVTRKGSERIVRYAFELARNNGRKKVTAVHKANIIKTSSGLFLDVAREVAKEYPEIEFQEMIVDNACMQLVMNPHQFDVVVTTNLFGDILSDLCAGLVGGLGLAPGANIGESAAIFEAVHGSAPDIAGKKLANPCALLLAAAQMLDHLGMVEKGTAIRQGIRTVLETRRDMVTPDMGGTGNTDTFADALVELFNA